MILIREQPDASRVLQSLSSSAFLDRALDEACKICDFDWWIAGGAVRDCIWSADKNIDPTKVIQDIDLLFFNRDCVTPDLDRSIEQALASIKGVKWSVKNQARMHIRNNDPPYKNLSEAVFCAPDTISSIIVTRTQNNAFVLNSSFGFRDLLQRIFRPTPYFMDKYSFYHYVDRISEKKWLKRWPEASILPWI